MADQTKQQDRPREESRSRSLARREPYDRWLDPFNSMRRMSEERDRWFGEPFWGRSWLAPWSAVGAGSSWPQVEAFHRGNEFVVRADVPGMKRDDITLEIRDDALIIQGERRQEHEEEKEGFFRSERSYGSFCRAIPLPEGAIADSAKATFHDGVLEVVMQAPPREVSRGRRIEISGESPSREKSGVGDKPSR